MYSYSIQSFFTSIFASTVHVPDIFITYKYFYKFVNYITFFYLIDRYVCITYFNYMHISSIKIQPLVKNINSVVIRMFIFFKISFYKVIVFEFTYQLPVVVLIEFLFRKLMFHSLQKYSADNRNIAACLNTLTGRCGTCFSIHTAHVVVQPARVLKTIG